MGSWGFIDNLPLYVFFPPHIYTHLISTENVHHICIFPRLTLLLAIV